MNAMLAEEKYRSAQLQKRIFESVADSYVNQDRVVHFEDGLDSVQVRQLADAIAQRCDGWAAVFSGGDGEGYAFAMVSRQADLRALGKEMTAALHGRGGGKPNFQQGRVNATHSQIEAFFEE